jgi:adhesin transport system membrane fusion protein
MLVADTTPGLDPLRPPSGAARAVVAVLAGGFLLALGWSTIVQIDVSATGTGRIVPARQVQVVQNLEGGIVQELLVKEGDQVKQDQVVARIQDTEFAASLQEASTNSAGFQAELARLRAEVEGRPLSFPADVTARFPDLVMKETNLFQSRRAELDGTVQAYGQQAARARNDIKKATESLPNLRDQLALAREQKGILHPQVEKGLISRVEELSVDQRILEIEGRIREAQRAIPAASQAAAEAEAKIRQERARFRSEALAHFTETQVKLDALGATLKAHRDRVKRRDVRSPVNGIVKKLKVTTLGEVVRPGDSILEIVPTDDQLLVEAKFSPKDIAFIHPGQRASIRITAYDASIYGALPAEVTQVSADATETQREEVYYLVRAKATRGFPQQAQQPLPLMPGMVAQVDVVTTKRSLFDYLVKPLTKLKYTSLHER